MVFNKKSNLHCLGPFCLYKGQHRLEANKKINIAVWHIYNYWAITLNIMTSCINAIFNIEKSLSKDTNHTKCAFIDYIFIKGIIFSNYILTQSRRNIFSDQLILIQLGVSYTELNSRRQIKKVDRWIKFEIRSSSSGKHVSDQKLIWQSIGTPVDQSVLFWAKTDWSKLPIGIRHYRSCRFSSLLNIYL